MATGGFFTYHDLYAGKPEQYHHQINVRLLSSDTTQLVSILNTTTTTTTTTSIPTTAHVLELVLSTTTLQTNIESYKFVQLIPFAYFHWFLVGLALLLTLLLTIIFTYYCRSHCRKHNKSYNEKKQPLPSFYRYRKPNGRINAHNIYEPTTPFPFPSPTRPCPSKSIERRNNQLLREGLDAVGSPRLARSDISHAEPSSSFSSTASDLLTEMKSRLSIRSSKSSLNTERLYETQRANMALNDDSKHDSLLIDIR